jgi:membrane protein YdbS with pleckstrin-like domain
MLEWAVAATLVISILVLFVAASISVATYPFNPRPVINAVLMVLFLTIGFVIVLIYSQMHRDAILSYVTDTNPGELGADF